MAISQTVRAIPPTARTRRQTVMARINSQGKLPNYKGNHFNCQDSRPNCQYTLSWLPSHKLDIQ
ncbi:chaperone [Bacillus sp. OxB-1]|nr:chaperone [Bacillus sp. OxB-1]